MVSSTLQDLLNRFEGLPLQQLPKNATLLDRVDTKYVLPLDKLQQVLAWCGDYYKVVTVNGHASCRYLTTYFDSPDLSFYHAHHAGHGNRVKVRMRNYVETDTRFLEVKYRNNKGRTQKPRVLLQGEPANLLGHLSSPEFTGVPLLQSPLLSPSAMVNYTRITLLSRSSAERVTIDVGLEFKDDQHTVHLPDLVIAEVKQDKQSNSPFKQLMKAMHMPAGAISKYCLGIISLNENVKKNRFKHKLLQIKKRTNYHVVITNHQ